MNVVKTIEEVRGLVGQARSAGKSVGLVPTMGALHAGHLSLIDAAAAQSDFVAVSIFVNPAQFAPGEDLAEYPRTPQADLTACEARGVDLVFTPTPETMYARGGLTRVTVEGLGERLCGHSRPTHFAGVCTVVAKLLNIFSPDKAFFGAKDFQQAAMVRRMAADLNFPVQIVVCPTAREADGLAMSSRNSYLSESERVQAAALYQSLRLAERMMRGGAAPPGEVIAAMRAHLAEWAPNGKIDYIEMVDPDELTDVETTDRAVLVALAVTFSRTRLIDNLLIA